MGERAGVLHSFKDAYGRVPESAVDWKDVLNISAGAFPQQRNENAEQNARTIAQKLYNQGAIGSIEKRDVMVLAYGLRPETRDMQRERTGIGTFVRLYGTVPASTSEWNIIRLLSY